MVAIQKDVIGKEHCVILSLFKIQSNRECKLLSGLILFSQLFSTKYFVKYKLKNPRQSEVRLVSNRHYVLKKMERDRDKK